MARSFWIVPVVVGTGLLAGCVQGTDLQRAGVGAAAGAGVAAVAGTSVATGAVVGAAAGALADDVAYALD
ncbi:hypothetical protein [Tropicimonas sp. IMCC6043]|uniref:hypothetical protein n=1 Tax=Tropicimonas sp. IMCC6043 TaxID=2510645 RepID=UPI00101CCCCE|nr:hypothetical protein [Tropicimonas sp. IMCC6043]RYH10671.1 hypothetical protein EU800_08005 [Tropicimonas sp. IMCC6043]